MVKVVVIGPARSGTTAVVHSLHSHPELTPVAYEIFHKHPTPRNTGIYDGSIQGYLHERGIQEYPSPSQMEQLPLEDIAEFVLQTYNGFKVLYQHLSKESKVWSYLKSRDDVRIIRMWRDNLLESLLSVERAKATGVWNSMDPDKIPPPDRKVRIPITVATATMNRHEKDNNHYAALFDSRTNPHVLDLEYEELYDWDQMTAKVQDFLGLSRVEVEMGLVKVTRGKPCDLIENYSELYECFSGGPWERFFATP